jgi:hypothetical protein
MVGTLAGVARRAEGRAAVAAGPRRSPWLAAALLMTLAAGGIGVGLAAAQQPERPGGEQGAGPAGLPPLKVVGAHLTTPDGKVASLRGVNLPTLEWGQGENLFRSLDVLVDEWKVNFIRLTLSGDRWFGHTKERKDGGIHYRQTVRELVKRAAAKRCYVLLNLMFLNPGMWLDEDPLQNGQYVVWWNSKMPDDHSALFWASAAKEFANHPAVLFDLYNEPRGVSWQVWRDGGDLFETHKKAPGVKREYHSLGMQKLVDICRAQGARNVVVAEGLDWGFDLSGIVNGYALKDPGGNLAYSTHLYGWTYGGPRDLDRYVTPAAKRYAVLIGETCAGKSNSVEPVVSYADQYQLPWLAWAFHPAIGPQLIKSWKYEPTPYGESVKKTLWEAANGERGWVPLFNGNDLTGWKTSPDHKGKWAVKDGAIVASGPLGYIFSEAGDYESFHIRIEAKINAAGDSGLFFRCQPGKGHPKGYEAQIDVSASAPIKTGSLYPAFNPRLTPEERDLIIVDTPPHKADEWFTQEVIADGNFIVIKVNGRITAALVDKNRTYTKGHIAIQHLNPATVIQVRKVEVKRLPATEEGK